MDHALPLKPMDICLCYLSEDFQKILDWSHKHYGINFPGQPQMENITSIFPQEQKNRITFSSTKMQSVAKKSIQYIFEITIGKFFI